MPEAMYFGVGEDDSGWFYAVSVNGAYRVCPQRYGTMSQAVAAMMLKVERVRQVIQDRPDDTAWTN